MMQKNVLYIVANGKYTIVYLFAIYIIPFSLIGGCNSSSPAEDLPVNNQDIDSLLDNINSYDTSQQRQAAAVLAAR
jgi:hypothetical protein